MDACLSVTKAISVPNQSPSSATASACRMPAMAMAAPQLGLPSKPSTPVLRASPRFIEGRRRRMLAVRASDSAASKKVVRSYASYAVPMENQTTSSFITRPLAEILADMNKRVPDKVLKIKLSDEGIHSKYIPWYHANRMLSFYAPGWSGEVRSIIFAADGRTVSVVYRVTLRGVDGETWREATGTATLDSSNLVDPVQHAEGEAFQRACARFGLGLYLYHEDDSS